jgi:hypothetical protein
MSSSNASRLLVHPVNRQHIFLPSLFFSWYIDWQARLQTAAWKYALCVFLHRVQTPERVGLAVLLKKKYYWFSRTSNGSPNTL